MAITFNKKTWKSRISEHPTRRRLTIVDQSLSYSLVDVSRDEGTVEQVGDTFDKSTMDDLETRIENLAISAQAECDGIQTEIDNLPSLDETKRVDIGYKETGMNENGGSVRVNPFEVYSGTVGTKIGKNLFVKGNTATSAGVTYTVNSDGSISLSGTSSATSFFTAFENVPITSGTYSLSQTGHSTIHFYIRKDTASGVNLMDASTSSATATLGAQNIAGVIRINSGVNCDGITLYPQLEEGETATAYEPYTESVVINGFIPSARFIEVGRKYMQEAFVTNHPTELNDYHKGYILQSGTTDKWISYEESDAKVNSIWTQYGYDTEEQEFLESVAGEIYTPTGAIAVDLVVSDIWMCGANGYSGTGIPSSPSREYNRLATNANGFPIELKPTNQSAVASLAVGSSVSFRITGTLWIVTEYDLLRDRETLRNDSKFYEFAGGIDARDGVHYSKHYIDIERGTTFNLSTVTSLTNYHFLQASVDDPEMLDFISWTVTDSNIAITGDDFATGIVLHIEHRRDGETESDLDTKEDIVINVI